MRWWPGGTNDEPRWLVVIVDQQERMDDKPMWLVIVEVVRWWPGGTNNEPRWLVIVVVACAGGGKW